MSDEQILVWATGLVRELFRCQLVQTAQDWNGSELTLDHEPEGRRQFVLQGLRQLYYRVHGEILDYDQTHPIVLRPGE